MFKKLILFVFAFFALSILGTSLTKALDTQVVADVNSFELFWPLAAGKTVEEPTFILKSLKENLRGMLIFSSAKKADYAVFLGTKRVLEAEKLINEGKKDPAKKTLKLASNQFDKAQKNIEKVLAGDGSFGDSKTEMTTRLNNVETLLKWLISKDSLDLKGDLEGVLNKVIAATSKL